MYQGVWSWIGDCVLHDGPFYKADEWTHDWFHGNRDRWWGYNQMVRPFRLRYAVPFRWIVTALKSEVPGVVASFMYNQMMKITEETIST